MGQRRIGTRHIVAVVVLMAFCESASALNRALEAGQCAHTAWEMRDGFPRGVVNDIAQDKDGYLWLGTEFGMVRFDGVKAVEWRPPPRQQLDGHPVGALLESRDGTILAGSVAGTLCEIRAARSHCVEDDSLARGIFGFHESRAGVVWASTSRGLLRWRPAPRTFYAVPDAGNGVQGFAEDTAAIAYRKVTAGSGGHA